MRPHQQLPPATLGRRHADTGCAAVWATLGARRTVLRPIGHSSSTTTHPRQCPRSGDVVQLHRFGLFVVQCSTRGRVWLLRVGFAGTLYAVRPQGILTNHSLKWRLERGQRLKRAVLHTWARRTRRKTLCLCLKRMGWESLFEVLEPYV